MHITKTYNLEAMHMPHKLNEKLRKWLKWVILCKFPFPHFY